MWNKFPKKIKNEILNKGKTIIKNGGYEYPITYQLIKDGKKNKVLNKIINSKIKVTMIHGKSDEVVPVSSSRSVLSIFKKARRKIVVVRGGDHSLSSTKHLKIILRELKEVIKDFV